MEAILAYHPAKSTEWLDCCPKSCKPSRDRTGTIGRCTVTMKQRWHTFARSCWSAAETEFCFSLWSELYEKLRQKPFLLSLMVSFLSQNVTFFGRNTLAADLKWWSVTWSSVSCVFYYYLSVLLFSLFNLLVLLALLFCSPILHFTFPSSQPCCKSTMIWPLPFPALSAFLHFLSNFMYMKVQKNVEVNNYHPCRQITGISYRRVSHDVVTKETSATGWWPWMIYSLKHLDLKK